MTTELYANAFQTTLTAAITTTPAPGTVETISVLNVAPAALQGSGQFRVTIDSEYLIVTGGQSTTTWTVTRGAEGSPTATHTNGTTVFHYLTAGAIQNLLNGVVSTTSLDSALPAHVQIADSSVDLNRAPYNAVPGADITSILQQAINDLTGTTTGQTGVTPTAAQSGEIYFSQPGTYLISGTVQSGTVSGTGVLPKPGGSANSMAYAAQILLPGILGPATTGCSIKIRGLSRRVWSSAGLQPGVILQSNANGGDMFAQMPAATGTYPALSQINLQFENLTFVNTNANGGGIDGWSCGSLQTHSCTFMNTTGTGNGGINSTRTALMYPHQIQHGDLHCHNVGIGGYKSGVQIGEWVAFTGWTAITSCQNAFDLSGGGAASDLGFVWMSNCQTVFNAISAPGHIYGTILWEPGGIGATQGARFINDPSGLISGSIKVHQTGQNEGFVTQSFCSTAGQGGGNPVGSPLDIQVLTGGVSWRGLHPVDTFQRLRPPLAASDAPGHCSDTWHPWRVQAGVATLNGTTSVNGAGQTFPTGTLTVASTAGFAAAGQILVAGVTGTVTYTGVTGTTFTGCTGGTGTATDTGAVTGVQGTGNGILSATTSPFSTYVPVKRARWGGESRTVTANITFQSVLGAGTAVYANNAIGSGGGATNLNKISTTVAANGSISLGISGTGTVGTTAAGLIVGGSSHTLSLRLIVGDDGTPSRVAVMLDNAKVLAHKLTTAERAAVGTPGAHFPFLEDGLQINDTAGTVVTAFSVHAIQEESNRAPIGALAQSGGGTLATDVNAGEWQTVTVADSTAFTVGTPANPPDSTLTQDLVFEFVAPAGSATGAITFQAAGTAAFKMGTATFTAPSAANKKRWARFKWNGANWIFMSQSASDY